MVSLFSDFAGSLNLPSECASISVSFIFPGGLAALSHVVGVELSVCLPTVVSIVTTDTGSLASRKFVFGDCERLVPCFHAGRYHLLAIAVREKQLPLGLLTGLMPNTPKFA